MQGLNWHAAPAFLAVIACTIILFLTHHRGANTYTARLYRVVVLMWLVHNTCELALFVFANNDLTGTLQTGILYYTLSVLAIALLSHLSLALATDIKTRRYHIYYLVALYTPAAILQFPLWLGHSMVTGYKPDDGVMPGVAWNSLHGPNYIYLLLIGFMMYMAITTVTLLMGIRSQNKPRRLQCYVMLFSSLPLFVFANVIILQLLRILPLNPYINATFAAPFGIIIYCIGTGYAIYRHRLVDIEFYIPWSQERRTKTEFYRQIKAVSELLPRSFDLEEAMRHVAAALNCPVVVRSKDETLMTPSESSQLMAEFPLQALSQYDSIVTVDDAARSSPVLANLLRKHKIFAVVPVPQGRGADAVVTWVFLGESLSERVYSSRDFVMVGILFQRMETVFHNQIGDVRREMNEMRQSMQGLQATLKEMAEAAATARATARAKDVFLGMISHELRTPLQTIVSSIDLLSGRRHDQRDTKVIHRLENAARRLETQMKDLTDYAKLGAGKLEIRKSLFDVGRLVRECVEEHANIANEKRIALTYDAACSNCPQHIWADPDRIRQILSNLLTNALKYTEQGSIRVTCLCLDGDLMKLAVDDTGAGIPPDQIQNVFQPFSQLDSSSARRHEGAGLGLAIVNGLVELLGGSIHVDSEVGRGTCLEVTLPYEPGSLLPLAAARSGNNADKLRILVVDDHPEIRESFSEMLETLGYSCDTSPDADDAIGRLVRQNYGALLLDIHMPGKNGYDVVNDLHRQTGPNRSIPVIAITAYAEDVIEPSMRHKFDEFLIKPVRIDVLRMTLARFLPMHSHETKVFNNTPG
ncbi:MAG: hybrid sensor histidine kinase/response regulator [Sulfuricaulis sp.]